MTLGISSLAKHYHSLYKSEKKRRYDDELEKINEKIIEAVNNGNQNILNVLEKNIEALSNETTQLNNKVEATIEELHKLKAGVLSIYKKEFTQDCRKLLDPAHIITYDEFQNVSRNHEVYNGLGGNHEGDEMFAIVKEKYQDQTTAK